MGVRAFGLGWAGEREPTPNSLDSLLSEAFPSGSYLALLCVGSAHPEPRRLQLDGEFRLLKSKVSHGGWRRGHGSREDRGEGKGHRKQDERTVSGLVSQKPVELFPYLSSLSIYLNLIFSNVYHI